MRLTLIRPDARAETQRATACEAGCTHPATVVTAWRSPQMAAPSFLYECDLHAAETAADFEREHPYDVIEQRRLVAGRRTA